MLIVAGLHQIPYLRLKKSMTSRAIRIFPASISTSAGRCLAEIAANASAKNSRRPSASGCRWNSLAR
jgi:hypothetical protein